MYSYEEDTCIQPTKKKKRKKKRNNEVIKEQNVK